MNIEPLNPESSAAQTLIAKSDAYMSALYPSISNHLADVQALLLPNVLFLGAYIEGELVACGAVKTRTDDGTYGEIKRIFILEQHRGKGLSKAIMQRLEAHLKAGGASLKPASGNPKRSGYTGNSDTSSEARLAATRSTH